MANLKINGHYATTFVDEQIEEQTPAQCATNQYNFVGSTGQECVLVSCYIDNDINSNISDTSGISIQIDVDGTWTTVVKNCSVNGYPKFGGISYLIPPNTSYQCVGWGLEGGANQFKVFTCKIITK